MENVIVFRTNVPPYTSRLLDVIDAVADTKGARLVDGIDWTAFSTVRGDPLHFTWRGYRAFASALVHALHTATADVSSRVHVITDSTVGYWNDDGRAAEFLRATGQAHGMQLTVDAVNGSGYVAGGVDICARIRRAPRGASIALLIGWNDDDEQRYTPTRLRGAVSAALECAVARDGGKRV